MLFKRHGANNQEYAPALSYMMNNAFGALGHTANDKDYNSTGTVATQVVALTLQNQLTAITAVNTLQRHDHL
jgi:hypothetical protein